MWVMVDLKITLNYYQLIGRFSFTAEWETQAIANNINKIIQLTLILIKSILNTSIGLMHEIKEDEMTEKKEEFKLERSKLLSLSFGCRIIFTYPLQKSIMKISHCIDFTMISFLTRSSPPKENLCVNGTRMIMIRNRCGFQFSKFDPYHNKQFLFVFVNIWNSILIRVFVYACWICSKLNLKISLISRKITIKYGLKNNKDLRCDRHGI